ncbi:MAG: carboxypeptidase-like regulatory domain-containing protein [Pedobacter sp.]|nr:carboxypeptidase-like regulatory domain-containing protein [Pedobacter sp.]MDQ8051530.1 carboxypeptidase-like regulatory domain-containing protein [Pedobacter sp.]
MRPLLCLSLILIAIFARAQNIQGKIIDEVTGSGIPFVSIGIVGTNAASVSNENGDFILKAPAFPAKLRVSHVSYLLTELDLTESQEKLVISLKPASISLSEVTIDPFRAQRIVKEALEKAKIAGSLNFYVNAFYRQLTSLNNTPSQIYELFYDLKWNTMSVQGWLAKKSRYAQSSQETMFTLTNMSYLTFKNSGYLFPEKGGKFVSLQTLPLYQFTIEKYIEQANQKIAVITCKYKSPRKNLYYVNTTYYIGVDDSKIYRVENSLFNLPMDFKGVSPKIPPITTTVATFNGNNTAIPVLESVSTKMYLNLSANERPLHVGLSSLLIVYKADAAPNDQKFNNLDRKTKDRTVIESIKYDPEFWKDNPIVKQTALEDSFIKMMEGKSAFGTMINP